MKKIAFHIQKGGVGKTSLSGNVADFSAQYKKTVLVDCDPQGNASSWFLTGKEVKNVLVDALTGKCEVKDALFEVKRNFYILPTVEADRELKSYAETKLFQEPYVFDDLCSELEKLNFEVVFFDLSPGISQLERCVLLSCDEVITPMTPEYFSLDGLEMFSREIKSINKSYRKNLVHRKIVINNLNKSFKRHVESYSHFQKLDLDLFTIGQDSDIATCQFHHKSLKDFNPNSRTLSELEKLTQAILK